MDDGDAGAGHPGPHALLLQFELVGGAERCVAHDVSSSVSVFLLSRMC